MNRFYPQDNVLILTFIALFLFFYIISRNKKENKDSSEYKNIVRYSYGDEFYNYRGGTERIPKPELKDMDERKIYEETQIIEGFTGNIVEDDIIINGHSTCPVTGLPTSFTSCIQIPNRIISGLEKPIDAGFLVSVNCRSCLDTIQRSIENMGEYKVIYENDQLHLTKDNEKQQVLLGCNPTNLSKILRLAGTVSIN